MNVYINNKKEYKVNVVHKNVSQGCIKVRRSQSKNITKLLHNIKVHFMSYTMQNLCLHGISIHTNFHQNRSINECARMILAKKLVL